MVGSVFPAGPCPSLRRLCLRAGRILPAAAPFEEKATAPSPAEESKEEKGAKPDAPPLRPLMLIVDPVQGNDGMVEARDVDLRPLVAGFSLVRLDLPHIPAMEDSSGAFLRHLLRLLPDHQATLDTFRLGINGMNGLGIYSCADAEAILAGLEHHPSLREIHLTLDLNAEYVINSLWEDNPHRAELWRHRYRKAGKNLMLDEMRLTMMLEDMSL